ncbi:hypothetical protein [Brachybacterium sacelli]|uniref:Accessory Sec system protein Asp2 n=1 Tax=Brachybacterium sacelli TaxID=173364 RepID=A0ABS4WVU1_9MICO|nr:hypothetical protein [Brachybacterium sacelli]MBP2380201.1 hypothetical protein [Brachybacterium sacelli]
MNKVTAPLRRGIRSGARSIAYSTTSRDIARRLVEDPAAHRLRTMIEEKGHGAKLRRLASQQLPEGTFFAKLTIHHWNKHRNSSFRFLEGDRVVYGNKIEPPARGFDLEYRNIIVTSDQPSDFRLDIDAEYSLKIGRGAFTTAQQVRYDEQYGVEQHGDLHYSLRGNLKNPRRVLVTFPGFGPSTSRISYAVSYLKGITDADLSDTLMICFQDRYMVAGTYMLADNAGEALRPRVHAEIAGLLEKHGIPERELMLFGASKGGSIATYYAEGFPGAQLLAVVPQMNLPYYLNKPFFRDNLYRLPALRADPQPVDLMRQYFSEGRRIDYFYTDRDEQSNYSLVEFVQDVPGLTKYRVDGEHADVAKKALPTILSVMKRFLRGEAEDDSTPTVSCDQLTSFPDESGAGFQVRLGNDTPLPSGPTKNALLGGDLGRTKFRQLISPHAYPFVKYTVPTERLLHGLHDPASVSSLLFTGSDGTFRHGLLPAAEPPIEVASHARPAALCAELDLTPTLEPRTYSLLAGANAPVSTFEYEVEAGNPDADAVTLVLARSAADRADLDKDAMSGGARLVVTAVPPPGARGASRLAHRIAITAGVEKIRVLVISPDVSDAEVTAVKRLYGPEVVCEDLRPTDVRSATLPREIG